jgi:hypothetical protein
MVDCIICMATNKKAEREREREREREGGTRAAKECFLTVAHFVTFV